VRSAGDPTADVVRQIEVVDGLPNRRPPKPVPPNVNDPRLLPALMQFTHPDHVRWVGWKYEWVDKKKPGKPGKWTKVPKHLDGYNASSNDPATWSGFKDIWERYRAGRFDGIGLMLLGLPDVVAIDLDKVRDPQTGTLMVWVETLVDSCGSYCEITPSMAGLRVLGRYSGGKVHRNGPHPGGGSFELFADCERFITFTGLANGTAERWGDITPVVDELLAVLDNKKKTNGHAANADVDADAEPISLEVLSPVVVELLVQGTLNGKPVEKRGPAFARIIHAFRAGGHSFSSALATLVKYPAGVQTKYGARLRAEARRMWDKAELRESYKQKGYICGESGKPLANVANAITALRLSTEWQDQLQYDLFAEKLLNDGEPWGDVDDIRLAEWLQHAGVNVPPRVAGQAAYTIGFENNFHPVRDYLAGLVWDGTARIDTWLTVYLGMKTKPVAAGDEEDAKRAIAEQDYLAAVGSKFLIGCVARIMRPGCKADCALVLEGDQGILKSTAIVSLMPNKLWFTDELADLGTKDAALQLNGRWIVEWSELDNYSRAEVSRVKAYMSRAVDQFRPPYGTHVVSRPRQCCFAGTVNKSEYLRDETGARRFWPGKCGVIKVDEIKRDRDQLWAEAKVRFDKGERWWLDPDIEKQARVEQAARRVQDAWEPLIEDGVKRLPCVQIPLLLEYVLDLQVQYRDQRAVNRVAGCLQALKWEKRQVGKDTKILLNGHELSILRGKMAYFPPDPLQT
jgi:hypothetical protein